MYKKLKITSGVLFGLIVAVIALRYLQTHNFAVLNPAGVIAEKERGLIIFATLLSVIVVVPVFVMLFGFAWKYRESNTTARYTPDAAGSRTLETIWWVIPLLLITVLGVVTYKSTRELDPRAALASSHKPLTIQVVALQWKWLFIYPEQQIATVNELHIPEDTPINFEITSDAPMNSFWIPNLGGQIYAMSGMSMQLHLMANKPGSYPGSSANLSGAGFANMHFMAHAITGTEFVGWVQSVQAGSGLLNQAAYQRLARPSLDTATTSYAATLPGIYNSVIAKYRAPGEHMMQGGGN